MLTVFPGCPQLRSTNLADLRRVHHNRQMNNRKPVTLHRLREMHVLGEKIAMRTCYDAAFARVLDDAGVDSLLIGDSLGMVLQGRASTLAVSIDEMVYHTGCVV